MTDTADALQAHHALTWVANRWPDLRARLRPSTSTALSDTPRARTPYRAPIDLHVSDLIATITHTTTTYAHDLQNADPQWHPTTWRMPHLLTDIATRYGHWTAADPHTAHTFTTWAHDTQRRVRNTIERPPAPTYVGPCPHTHNDGTTCAHDLYLPPGAETGRCPECRNPINRTDQLTRLREALTTRLMTVPELRAALAILGDPIPVKTVRSWAARNRLPEAIPGSGLYHLTDAIALAGQRSPRADYRVSRGTA